MFLYYFDVLKSKIIFFLKKIILICFEMKNTLKNNGYYISKHAFKINVG